MRLLLYGLLLALPLAAQGVFVFDWNIRPFGFDENRGQYPAHVRFAQRSSLGGYYVTNREFFQQNGLRFEILGALDSARVIGIDPQDGAFNVFSGTDPRTYRRNERLYNAVRMNGILPEADLEWDTSSGLTLRIHRRGTASLAGVQIALRDRGIVLRPGAGFDLIAASESQPGIVTSLMSRTFGVSLRAVDRETFGLTIAGSENPETVEIHLGGFGRLLFPLTERLGADSEGNEYYAGDTGLSRMVAAGIIRGPFSSEETATAEDIFTPECYVMKYDNLGRRVWVSYFGGAARDVLQSGVLEANRLILHGTTESTNFPLLRAAQTANTGGAADHFFALFDPATGELARSTYHGTPESETATLKIDVRGERVLFSGLRTGIAAIAPRGFVNVFDLATNRFGTEIPAPRPPAWVRQTGNGVIALGMRGPGMAPRAMELALYRPTAVTPYATIALPVPPDAGSVTELIPDGAIADSEGNLWVHSTLDSPFDPTLTFPLFPRQLIHRVLVEEARIGATRIAGTRAARQPVYQLGRGNSLDVTFFDLHSSLPVTPDAQLAGACGESRYTMTLSTSGAITYASYLPDFLQTPGGITCIASAADRSLVQRVVPGQLVTLTGGGFDASDISRVRVRIDGRVAPVISGAPGLITVQVPYELNDTLAVLEVEAEVNGRLLPAFRTQLAASGLRYFETGALDPNLRTPVVAMLNQNGTVNTPANPARVGEVVTIFGTGAGGLDPLPATGGVHSASLARILSTGFVSVSTSRGGLSRSVEPVYQGSAPGLLTGVVQINFRVPDMVHTGVMGIGYSPSPRPGSGSPQGVFYVR
jgi:uncharacterized protein (TIGR03437 family)